MQPIRFVKLVFTAAKVTGLCIRVLALSLLFSSWIYASYIVYVFWALCVIFYISYSPSSMTVHANARSRCEDPRRQAKI